MQEVGQPFSDTSPYKVSENFLNWNSKLKVTMILGSGCGSVGRAVASNSRGTRFESSHWQKFNSLLNICLLSTVY